MENNEICPNGHPIKTVPAGISKKTGRSYNAFQVCEDRQHNWKPIAPPKTYTSHPSKTEQISAMQANKAKFIEQAQDRKSNSVNIFNAMNSAIALVCHHPFYQNIKDEKELLMVIYSLQTEFYRHNSKQDNFPAF